MYLSKYLSFCGLCSRRKSVELIKNKQIFVNEKIISDPAYVVKENDKVKYKNKIIKPLDFKYILLNKPKGYITTLSDEKNRKTIISLINDKSLGRIYPVGRLDRNTTGLLLLTNDGQLAQKLSHPSYEVFKNYHVVLDKDFIKKDFEQLKRGIRLKNGFAKVDILSYFKNFSKKHILVKIHSGKNRIIRRIFEYFGYKIKKLDRFQKRI